MIRNYWLIFFYMFFILQELGASVGSGYHDLLSKRYNELVYATTHNGQSHIKSLVYNQDKTITEQLKAGIRAIKIPLWFGLDAQGKGCICACHGLSKALLYTIPEQQILQQVPYLFRSNAKQMLHYIKPAVHMLQDAMRIVYGVDDTEQALLHFNHGMFDPACQPFENICAEVARFVQSACSEIVTLIIEDFTGDIDSIATAVKTSGLYQYVHAQDIDKPWPTIGWMIQQNKRVVLLVHSENGLRMQNYHWLTPLWDFAWDTRFSFKCTADFLQDRVPNRGAKAYEQRHNTPENKLFIVYHFITPFAGGDISWAKRVNRSSVLKKRLAKLMRETGHIPNFVQVDFFEYPHNDLIKVVTSMNNGKKI